MIGVSRSDSRGFDDGFLQIGDAIQSRSLQTISAAGFDLDGRMPRISSSPAATWAASGRSAHGCRGRAPLVRDVV